MKFDFYQKILRSGSVCFFHNFFIIVFRMCSSFFTMLNRVVLEKLKYTTSGIGGRAYFVMNL